MREQRLLRRPTQLAAFHAFAKIEDNGNDNEDDRDDDDDGDHSDNRCIWLLWTRNSARCFAYVVVLSFGKVCIMGKYSHSYFILRLQVVGHRVWYKEFSMNIFCVDK